MADVEDILAIRQAQKKEIRRTSTIDLESLLAGEKNEKVKKEYNELVEKALEGVKKAIPDRFIRLKDVRLSEILGSTEQTESVTKRFSKLQTKAIKLAKSALPSRNVKIKDFSVGEVIDPAGADATSSLRFRMLLMSAKKKVIRLIRRALPREFESVDPNEAITAILGEPRKDTLLFRLRYRSLKQKLMSGLLKGAGGLFRAKPIAIEENMSVGDIIGESPKNSKLFRFRYNSLKQKLMSGLLKGTSSFFKSKPIAVENDMTVGTILGSSPEEGILFKLRYAKLRHQLLTNIGKGVKSVGDIIIENDLVLSELVDTSKKIDPTKLLNKISLELGGAIVGPPPYAMGGSAGGNDLAALENQKEEKQIFEDMLNFLEITAENTEEDSGAGKEKKSGGGLFGKLLGGLGKGAGKGAGAFFSGFFKGLAKGLKKLSDPKLLIGTAVLAALGIALGVTGKALQNFEEVNWKSVGIGIAALGVLSIVTSFLAKAGPKILLGAVAIVAVAGAIFIAGKAFQQFAEINWKNVAIGSAVLAGFALVAGLLGPVVPAILLGALAIGALGVALVPFAYAMKLFSQAALPFAEGIAVIIDAVAGGFATVLETLGNTFDTMVSSIERLASVNGKSLTDTAGGLTAISAALLLFSASNLGGAVANLFSNILGGGPIKQIEKFSNMAPRLTEAADAIEKLAGGIKNFTPGTMTGAAEELKSFISTFKDGVFTKDPLKPLRKLAEEMEGLGAGVGSIYKMALAINTAAEKGSFDILSTQVGGLAMAINMLNEALESLDESMLEKVKNLAVKAGEATIEIADKLVSKVTGEEISQGSMDNKMAMEANRNASVIIAGGMGRQAPAQSGGNTSVTNYSQMNHIDETTQNVVYVNRF
jgi:hypothetical protein